MHHLIPLSSLSIGEERIYTAKDFAVLCSNCHRMIHRWPTPEEPRPWDLGQGLRETLCLGQCRHRFDVAHAPVGISRSEVAVEGFIARRPCGGLLDEKDRRCKASRRAATLPPIRASNRRLPHME